MSGPLSEDDLIAQVFAPHAGPGALGLKDDVACLAAPAGCDLVITKDALVAGVHFFPDDPPDAIARKALRVNVSDVIAKGADPMGFLLAAALPPDVTLAWLQAFAQALGEDAKLYNCPLLGGDTVRTPGPASFSITALGRVPAGRMVARTGARAGDALYVTGTIGDAALGLFARAGANDAPAWMRALSPEHRAHLRARYLVPQPRFALRGALRDHAHGAMDVSDGLVGDLAKMMRASGVGARVEMSRIPFSPAAQAAIAQDSSAQDSSAQVSSAQKPSPLEIALTGGDDYEILCAVGVAQASAFEAAAQAAGAPVTRIGLVRAEPGVDFVDAAGAPRAFARGSFSHF
jgi:thiamine-monophosphate kinase